MGEGRRSWPRGGSRLILPLLLLQLVVNDLIRMYPTCKGSRFLETCILVRIPRRRRWSCIEGRRGWTGFGEFL